MIDKKLRVLIDRIPKIAPDHNEVNPEQVALVKAIQQYGGTAIPLLLPYLKHPRSGVRELTIYILRDIQGLNPYHLDILIASERKESGLLPYAIARIGTPRAVAFLIEDLQRIKEADSPIGNAFKILGKKGVPALCHLLRSTPPADNKIVVATGLILQGLDEEARSVAVAPLLDIVLNSRVSTEKREYALHVVSHLGDVAIWCVPILKRLVQQEPAIFQQPVNKAFISLGVPEAVPLLLQDLQQNRRDTDHTQWKLQTMASLHSRGISAGPEIIKYFDHPDWDIRRTAVQVIGFLGFREAIPSLIQFLVNEEDWQLVWATAESLARLPAPEAQNTLEKLANQYWFPPVRNVAREALVHLRMNRPYAPSPFYFDPWRKLSLDFFARYRSSGGWKSLTPEPDNSAGSQMDVPDGTLVGQDRGEWMGNLTFVGKDGTKQILLSNNVQAITRFGTGIFAMSGLGHLSMNEGSVYRVTRDASRTWQAIRWRRLPGTPRWAVIQETGNGQVLRVACFGGDVDISPDGAMRFIG